MANKANYHEEDSWEGTLDLAKDQKNNKLLPKWASQIVDGILNVEDEEEILSIEEVIDIIQEEIERRGEEVILFGSSKKMEAKI